MLERSLGGTGAKVEQRVRLTDKHTGELREHDVVITLQQAHHKNLIALECRDRSRKVGVPELEAFHQKCADTGIHQGIIVSSAGFAETALTKAAAYGVRCFTLEEIETFDWFKSGSMQFANTTTTEIACTCIPAVQPAIRPMRFELLDDKDQVVTNEMLTANVQQVINTQNYGIQPAGEYTGNIRFAAPGYSIRDMDSGAMLALDRIEAKFTVRVEISQLPIQLLSYRDTSADKVLVESAMVPLGSLGFSLVATQKPGEGMLLQLVKH